MQIRQAHRIDVEVIAKLYVSNWKTIYRGLLPEEYLDRLAVPAAAEKVVSVLKAAGAPHLCGIRRFTLFRMISAMYSRSPKNCFGRALNPFCNSRFDNPKK